MKKNVGGLDRNIRLLSGSILVLIGIFAPLGAVWQAGIILIGAIALITGFTGL
ncbi:MAG: DUF2892 domain-containing protein [Desulfobulbaceae bacterium]|nr:DUF2892 domain-containing protein [Desulfobulbaceae bacterium]